MTDTENGKQVDAPEIPSTVSADPADIELLGHVGFKVVNYKKVYVRIERPNGSVSNVTYLRQTDTQYGITSRYIDYCWRTDRHPTKNECYGKYKGRLYNGQSRTF